MPWVQLAVLKVRIDIIYEFELEIYQEKQSMRLEDQEMRGSSRYLQIDETMTTEKR